MKRVEDPIEQKEKKGKEERRGRRGGEIETLAAV